MSESKPFSRNSSSTMTTDAGAIVTWLLSRKYSVSSTDVASASRSSSARSSRPTASGPGGVRSRDEDVDGAVGRRIGGDDLLGAAGAVALAPAHVWVLLDHLAQLEDPVHERLRPRRAARHVHVDRHELVGRDDRVVVEHAHR